MTTPRFGHGSEAAKQLAFSARISSNLSWLLREARGRVDMLEKPSQDWKRPQRLAAGWRILIEAGLIVFLIYSSLLMKEFERSGLGQTNGVTWALHDIFTETNFAIAFAAALIGCLVFECLREKF